MSPADLKIKLIQRILTMNQLELEKFSAFLIDINLESKNVLNEEKSVYNKKSITNNQPINLSENLDKILQEDHELLKKLAK